MELFKGRRTPYQPVERKPEMATAVQMLASGECPPQLQKDFLRCLIEEVYGTYQQSYFGDTHDTAFMEGRRWCGNTVITFSKLDPSQLAKIINQPSRRTSNG